MPDDDTLLDVARELVDALDQRDRATKALNECLADLEATRDWKAETRGLGYMILDIGRQWDELGDTELFRDRLCSAREHVAGPLRAALEADDA